MKAHRREPRVTFESRVHITGAHGPMEGTLCDLSRSGCRLRVSLGWFDIDEREAGLPAVLEAVRNAIGRGFALDMMPVDEGGERRSVSKSAVLVRMAVVPGEDTGTMPVLDLGCLFSEPLHDEEGRRLGLPLSALGSSEAESERERIVWDFVQGHGSRADGSEPKGPPRPVSFTRGGASSDASRRRLVARPKQRHAGSLRSAAPQGTGTDLLCHTDTLTPHAVIVRAGNALRYLGLRPGVDLATAAVAFTAKFGQRIHFAIGPTSRPIWSGPAAVCGFELPEDGGGDLLITLSFERMLDDAERQAVGL